MTDSTLLDNDDLFDTQIKEQEYKKRKKLEKQERLTRKKALLDEIKSAVGQVNPAKSHETHTPPPLTFYKRGSLEWSLCILNAPQGSTFEELKRIYLALAQKYHPDKNMGQTTQEMKDLNEAWEKVKSLR